MPHFHVTPKAVSITQFWQYTSIPQHGKWKPHHSTCIPLCLQWFTDIAITAEWNSQQLVLCATWLYTNAVTAESWQCCLRSL